MKRENLAYLLIGALFGVLVGFGIFYYLGPSPHAVAASRGGPLPAGPQASGSAPAMPPPDMSQSATVKEIEALKRHIEEAPDDVGALTRLANIFHDLSMWEEAIPYYEKAVDLSPEDPDLITDLGICYRMLTRYDEALEMFDRAQAADPTHWQSLYNTVLVAGFAVGDRERAMAALAKLEKVNPSAPKLAELRHGLEHVGEAGATGGGS